MGGGVEVAAATTCLHWSHPVVSSHHQSPSCRRLGSAISSPSFRKSRDQVLSCRVVAINPWNRSSNYSSSSSTTNQLMITRPPTRAKPLLLRRAFSASLDGFFSDDEELAKQIQELAIRFDEEEEDQLDNFNDNFSSNCSNNPKSSSDSASSSSPPWDKLGIQSNIIERKANSVDLPLSLRLIKKKNQLREGFAEAGESAYCSVKKAFSSMVFIIRELHSYSLQALFYDDLQGVLVRVQREMHASFVWLFQQIFSHTPTLMVYVMILLANFTVHSMAAHNTAIAASPPVPTPTETASTYSSSSSVREEAENDKYYDVKFDSSTLKTYSNYSYSVGGGNGSGGKIRPTSSGTDGGDGQFNRHRQIVPDEIGTSSSTVGNGAAEEKGVVKSEDEARVWNEMVDEAWRMRAESLDEETMQMFVSPVTVEIESDQGYVDHYFRTEVMYLHAMAQDPHNTLLLSNYAQFLYLVVHDHDRAEEYFKRAVEVKPADAEALRRYATFLWLGKNDLCAAEETFLEAIEADPGNTYHAANYAHFLWNTGGEDTCFPLSSPNDDEHHNAA